MPFTNIIQTDQHLLLASTPPDMKFQIIECIIWLYISRIRYDIIFIFLSHSVCFVLVSLCSTFFFLNFTTQVVTADGCPTLGLVLPCLCVKREYFLPTVTEYLLVKKSTCWAFQTNIAFFYLEVTVVLKLHHINTVEQKFYWSCSGITHALNSCVILLWECVFLIYSERYYVTSI